MNLIKILVCCHKPCELPNGDIYLPIQVGKKCSNLDLGIQSDCEINGQDCENISEKNNIYCEMTAAYWAWKNIRKLYPNIDYIGLCHYRRYFNINWSRLDSVKIFARKMAAIDEELLRYYINILEKKR